MENAIKGNDKRNVKILKFILESIFRKIIRKEEMVKVGDNIYRCAVCAPESVIDSRRKTIDADDAKT